MLCRLRGKGGTQPASAKEHELLVVRKYRFVIRTLRIDPEFQHPARAVESSRHLTLSLQFANVANIDQHRVLVPNELYRFLDRQGLDLSFSGLAQGLVTCRNPLRHGSPRDGLSISIAEWLRVPTPRPQIGPPCRLLQSSAQSKWQRAQTIPIRIAIAATATNASEAAPTVTSWSDNAPVSLISCWVTGLAGKIDRKSNAKGAPLLQRHRFDGARARQRELGRTNRPRL